MQGELVVVQVMALLVGITIHEMSHGWMAHRLGDATAKAHGRLTINPLAHIDPFGTILLPALLILTHSPVLIGWAKPVPVNPAFFKNPRKGWALVSAAGPISNLLVAVVAGALLKANILWPAAAGAISTPLFYFLLYAVYVNVTLAVFNLVPVPPLDGGHFLEGALPLDLAREYRKIEPYGMIIIFALLYFGLLNRVLAPIQQAISLLILS